MKYNERRCTAIKTPCDIIDDYTCCIECEYLEICDQACPYLRTEKPMVEKPEECQAFKIVKDGS